ncbi:DKNYY domain-containing protein [Maribacter sp. 2308TA10-17]|uniref:DKNYY domain-containing protein n=1 Tax=Maribacter sp. 2308TA10-17 TaxID=3386276 RepID=UPI0039BC479C
MKTLFKILIAPLFWIFQACSPLGNPVDAEKSDSHYYNNSENQIRYSPMGNWFELGNSEIPADFASFEVLSRWLSKDKDRIYFEAFPVENRSIDLADFYVKDEEYLSDVGFDENHVYVFNKIHNGESYEGVVQVVEGANPKTYSRTLGDWANDGINHFYQNNKVDADFDSFEVLNLYFAKDASKTFVQEDQKFRFFEANPSTLKILGESDHALDDKNVYWLSFFTEDSPHLISIPYINESEVKYLNHYFLKISNTIYCDGTPRHDIDAKSFEIIDYWYAKDSRHVYYKNKIVQNADPESFRKKKMSHMYVDKNGIYDEGQLQE